VGVNTKQHSAEFRAPVAVDVICCQLVISLSRFNTGTDISRLVF
jgi:hypothetical protein